VKENKKKEQPAKLERKKERLKKQLKRDTACKTSTEKNQ